MAAHLNTEPNPDPTPMERRVQRLIAHGWPNKNIAFELDILETTVKAHVMHLNQKLRTTNRVQLALDWHGIDFRKTPEKD